MKQHLVIYHADCLDGFTAAWCAWCKFGDEAEYVPAKYGDTPPDVTGRDVLIADFSYSRHVLLELKSKANSIRVLDHHKTAEEELRGLDFCLFDMNRSGAGISFDELHPERGGARVALVNYVEDRDLWRFALPQSKEVNAYINSFDQTFEQWSKLDGELSRGSGVPKAAEFGLQLLRGVDRYVKEMSAHARAVSLPETWLPPSPIIVPVVNAPYINTSELVGHLAEVGQKEYLAPFAVGWFQRGDGKYQYSLRSRGEFDVSAVAKRFGGGGHRNAAGFVVDRRVDL